ncbi:MAG: DUF4908 domain-containing protein [Pseudomonadota bacterium]
MIRIGRFATFYVAAMAGIAALSVGAHAGAEEPVSLTAAPETQAATAPSYIVPVAANDPFSALVGKGNRQREDRRGEARIERYVLAADDRSFLFEDRSGAARIKFLCSGEDARVECVIDPFGPAEEIHLLSANRAPRGDVIYKDDDGKTLLRIASYGGATVYWPGEAQGAAASKSFGESKKLDLPFADYDTAMRRAHNATAIISAATGAAIVFDIGARPVREGENNAVLADAVVVAAKALVGVAGDKTGARALGARVSTVSFVAGETPGVTLDGKDLAITYMRFGGLEARPSSSVLRRHLEASL